jgi:uncharacterized membrane protein
MPEQQSEEDIPSYIPDVLPKNNSIAQQTDKSQLSLSYREGPITPDELREYNDLVPGFAQDYLNEVIREVQHHRDIERERIEIEKGELAQEGETVRVQERIFRSNQRRSIWGSIAGTTIALTAIGCATFLGSNGHKEVAIAVVGSLAGTAAIIYGTDAHNKSRQKELEARESDDETKKIDEGDG